jgi:hypothetical protein
MKALVACAIAVLASAGCAGIVAGMVATPNSTRDISLLRSQSGACADGVLNSGFGLVSTTVTACARTGAPFML